MASNAGIILIGGLLIVMVIDLLLFSTDLVVSCAIAKKTGEGYILLLRCPSNDAIVIHFEQRRFSTFGHLKEHFEGNIKQVNHSQCSLKSKRLRS